MLGESSECTRWGSSPVKGMPVPAWQNDRVAVHGPDGAPDPLVPSPVPVPVATVRQGRGHALRDMHDVQGWYQHPSFESRVAVAHPPSPQPLPPSPWPKWSCGELGYVSRSLLKFMYIELVMLSNHLILCHCLLLLPSIFPSIKVFSSESSLRIRWPNSGASDSASVLPMNSRVSASNTLDQLGLDPGSSLEISYRA